MPNGRLKRSLTALHAEIEYLCSLTTNPENIAPDSFVLVEFECKARRLILTFMKSQGHFFKLKASDVAKAFEGGIASWHHPCEHWERCICARHFPRNGYIQTFLARETFGELGAFRL